MASTITSTGDVELIADVQEVDDTDRSTTLTDHQLMLLDPQAPAFALSAKQWSK